MSHSIVPSPARHKTRRSARGRLATLLALPFFALLALVALATSKPLAQATATAAVKVEPLPPEMKPYTETIPGTNVKFEMVPIPGGTFLMGSPPGEAGRNEDEGPQHLVTVQPFWMGKTEVTWDEYDVFAFSQDIESKEARGVDFSKEPESEKVADAMTRPTPPYEDETFGYGRHGQPVINITHHAAMEYTFWLSTLTGKTYRLPTEAEWEFAARAGAETAYFFGDNPGKLSEYAWYLDDARVRPHPVGQKQPNPWGLYDILGNVAEWVLDRYDKDYYRTFKPLLPALEPVLLPGKEKFPHVVRGGGWTDPARMLRSAARRASDPTWLLQDPQRPQSIWWLTDALFVGFRIIRPLHEQKNLKGLRSKVTKYD